MKLPRRLSITQALFAITASVTASLAVVLIIYANWSAREEAMIAAHELMSESMETVQLRAQQLMQPIESVLELSPYWAHVEASPTADGHDERERFLSILGIMPHVAAIFIGNDAGEFYYLSAIDQSSDPQSAEPAAPETAAFVERVILPDAPPGEQQVESFLDGAGQRLSSWSADPGDFDPRQRPWYAAAQATDGVARSPVYIFARSQQPGISLSRRNGRAVVGIDLSLRNLSAFLQGLPQAEHGLVGVVDRDGDVLISSAVSQAIPDELVAFATANGEVSRDLELDGEPWIAQLASVGPEDEAGRILVVAMPLAEITQSIDRVAQRSAIVSVALVLIALPLIWLVARLMSAPLQRLALEADQIRAFDLTERDQSGSAVREIERLEASMSSMRGGLRTLALYVPKALVRQLVARNEEPEIGGKRRDVTLLFLDLENFTAMSAALTADELMARMSRYFEVVTQILLKHEATIDKYIGDSVMAFWNAPGETADHTAKACAAALAIIDELRAETDEWSKSAGLRLRTRIGIHSGEAVIGNVGSSDRMNYTALGATVNLASRLEGLNRELGTSVLVSEEVVARVGERFDFKPMGAQQVKGYEAPVKVFELVVAAPATGGRQA